MRHVEIELHVPGRAAAEVYTILSAFEHFPRHTRALRSVRISHAGDGRLWSTWEVGFRGGMLRWREEDRFDRKGLAIRFRQTDGDLDHFAGAWEVAERPDGCAVRFVADFALGRTPLAPLLEPIAERALRRAVGSIVAGRLSASDAPSAPPAFAPAPLAA